MDIKSLNKKLLTQILLALFVLISSLCLYDVQLMTSFSWFLLVSLLVIRCITCPIVGENNDMEILNSSQRKRVSYLIYSCFVELQLFLLVALRLTQQLLFNNISEI